MGKFNAPQTPPDVQNEYAKRKKVMGEAFIEFHKAFTSKVLDRNKSAAVKKTETAISEKLIQTAVDLEKLNAGEGLIALAAVSLKEQMKLRDRINELEYELLKALQTIKEVTGKKDEPKKP